MFFGTPSGYLEVFFAFYTCITEWHAHFSFLDDNHV